VDTGEKKKDWFLNGLNDVLAYALEAHDFINFQKMVDKALVLENRRGIMEQKRKMKHTGPQGSNTRFRVGSSHHKDLIFTQVSRLDSLECVLWVKDFNLPSDRFNAPTFKLLALHHHHHHKEIVMHKILVLWDLATVVVRLGTILIGVPRSKQIRLQLQAQIRSSTAMLTT
jgi:hypothetical protein